MKKKYDGETALYLIEDVFLIFRPGEMTIRETNSKGYRRRAQP